MHKLILFFVAVTFLISASQGVSANNDLKDQVKTEFIELAKAGKIHTLSTESGALNEYSPIAKDDNGSPVFAGIMVDSCSSPAQTKKFVKQVLRGPYFEALKSHPTFVEFKTLALSGKYQSCLIFDSEDESNPKNGAGVYYLLLISMNGKILNNFAMPAGWED